MKTVIALILLVVCAGASPAIRRHDGETREHFTVTDIAQNELPDDYSQIVETPVMPLTQSTVTCPTSKNFTLSLKGQKFTDAQVQEVILNYIQQCLNQWQQVTNFTLDLSYNKITSVKCAVQAVRDMPYLASLDLYFRGNLIGNDGIFDVSTILQSNALLKSLTIDLSQNLITDFYPFKFAFQYVPLLKYLSLNLRANNPKDLQFTTTAFLRLTDLETLNLLVDYSKQLVNVAALSQAFQNLQKLKNLQIGLYKTAVQSLSFLTTAFQNLVSVKTVLLQLAYNNITDVSQFGVAFEKNTALKALYVYLNNNAITSGIDELSDGLYKDVAVRNAFCPLVFQIQNNLLDQSQVQKLQYLGQSMESIYNQTQCANRAFMFNVV